MADFELYRGDCLEVMADIADQSVDMILCDLPYGTTQNKWDSVIDLNVLWTFYKRVCRGVFVLTAQAPFDKVLGASNIGMLRYEWIWEKPKATGHLNAKRAPMKAHENILVFYDKMVVYNPQKTAGEPYKGRGGASKNDNYGGFDAVREGSDDGSRYPRSVLRFKHETKPQHPTAKPVALMEYLVQTYTNEGDVVMDNCMGSGTTGVACANTGRNFIGIEREKEYYHIARKRIAEAYNKKPA